MQFLVCHQTIAGATCFYLVFARKAKEQERLRRMHGVSGSRNGPYDGFIDDVEWVKSKGRVVYDTNNRKDVPPFDVPFCSFIYVASSA